MNTDVEDATYLTVNNDGHSHDRVQSFVLDLLVVLVGNRVCTCVVGNTRGAASVHHTTTDTGAGIEGEVLQRRGSQSDPLGDLQSVFRNEGSVHGNGDARRGLQRGECRTDRIVVVFDALRVHRHTCLPSTNRGHPFGLTRS